MKAVLDCGTTNTKCYLLEEDGTFCHESYGTFGVKDYALSQSRAVYGKKLHAMVEEAVKNFGREYRELTEVISFGMISSDLGLKMLPHVVTPAGLSKLNRGIYTWEDSLIFGNGIRFRIIPGIKNALREERALENIEICDFMRGEETQVMGILETYHPGKPCNVIVFSSHFKIIHVSAEGKIIQSMTTMSGQLFDCLKHHTVVGKSVDVGEDQAMRMTTEEIVSLAEKITQERGLNRALLCPRFMESFTQMTAMERLCYLNAVIGLEDLKSMGEYCQGQKFGADLFYFVGQEDRCRLFEHIFRQRCPDAGVELICGKEKNRDISIAGAWKIAGTEMRDR